MSPADKRQHTHTHTHTHENTVQKVKPAGIPLSEKNATVISPPGFEETEGGLFLPMFFNL